MARMKSKSQLGEKDIQKMIQEYWETLESEQRQSEGSNKNPPVRKPARFKGNND